MRQVFAKDIGTRGATDSLASSKYGEPGSHYFHPRRAPDFDPLQHKTRGIAAVVSDRHSITGTYDRLAPGRLRKGDHTRAPRSDTVKCRL